MKKLMVTLAALAFCATAWAAADDPSPEDGGRRPGTQAYSRAKFDPILGRLSLTDEQVKKVDELFAEYAKKAREIHTEMRKGMRNKRGGKEAWAKLREKTKELNAERDKKVYEVLTAEQQKKYDLAKKIIAGFQEKMAALGAEYKKVREDCGGDKKKMKASYKKLGAKRRELWTEQNKQLDEQVGKLPKGGVSPGIRKHFQGRGDEANG